jgi:hypothetical protein
VVVLALSARGSADLGIRRTIDQVIYRVRCELAAILTKLADQRGEPPLETRILTNAARHLA